MDPEKIKIAFQISLSVGTVFSWFAIFAFYIAFTGLFRGTGGKADNGQMNSDSCLLGLCAGLFLCAGYLAVVSSPSGGHMPTLLFVVYLVAGMVFLVGKEVEITKILIIDCLVWSAAILGIAYVCAYGVTGYAFEKVNNIELNYILLMCVGGALVALISRIVMWIVE